MLYESTGEKIVKIGPHLPTLVSNINWLTFWRLQLHCQIYLPFGAGGGASQRGVDVTLGYTADELSVTRQTVLCVVHLNEIHQN